MMYNNVYYVIVSVLYYNDTSTFDMFLFLPGYSFTIVWVLFVRLCCYTIKHPVTTFGSRSK